METLDEKMIAHEIFILGVGHWTDVIIELAEDCGYNVAGLFHYNDDRTGEVIHGIPVINSTYNLFNRMTVKGVNFAVSVGDNKIRSSLAKQIRSKGGITPSLIHSSAFVAKNVKLNEGTFIIERAIVQTGVTIGKDSVVSVGASAHHHSTIGEGCYLAGGSSLGAYIDMKNYAFLGLGVITIPGKVKYIGENALIGAGSVVVKDVDANTVVFGNPARVKP